MAKKLSTYAGRTANTHANKSAKGESLQSGTIYGEPVSMDLLRSFFNKHFYKKGTNDSSPGTGSNVWGKKGTDPVSMGDYDDSSWISIKVRGWSEVDATYNDSTEARLILNCYSVFSADKWKMTIGKGGAEGTGWSISKSAAGSNDMDSGHNINVVSNKSRDRSGYNAGAINSTSADFPVSVQFSFNNGGTYNTLSNFTAKMGYGTQVSKWDNGTVEREVPHQNGNFDHLSYA